jgi:hypothetical protein
MATAGTLCSTSPTEFDAKQPAFELYVHVIFQYFEASEHRGLKCEERSSPLMYGLDRKNR